MKNLKQPRLSKWAVTFVVVVNGVSKLITQIRFAPDRQTVKSGAIEAALEEFGTPPEGVAAVKLVR